MFQPAFERILANTTRASVESVVYPARLDQNVTSAAQNLQRLIKDALQDCPDQKYILFGYSQGATLILSALPGLSCEVDAIASIVRVGNPNRIPGRLSSVDRVGNRDFRHEYGRYAIEAMNQNETILQVSPTLDMPGRVKDICVEVGIGSKLYKVKADV